MGYEVQLYNPDSGKEVSHSVDSYSTYYAIKDKDKLQVEVEKAYVQVKIFISVLSMLVYYHISIRQVRVLHELLGAGAWSDGISLGKCL